MSETELLEELRDYCDLWGVTYETTLDNPEAALRILQALFAVPMLTTQEERHVEVNRIGQAIWQAFPVRNHPFHMEYAMLSGIIQEWPQRWHFLANTHRLSNRELIQAYDDIEAGKRHIIKALAVTGGWAARGASNIEGSLLRAGKEGLAAGLNSTNLRDAARNAVNAARDTARKPDNLRDAVQNRMGRAPRVGGANLYSALLTVTLTLALAEANDKLSILRKEAEIRFQKGTMSEREYGDMLNLGAYDELPTRYWDTLP